MNSHRHAVTGLVLGLTMIGLATFVKPSHAAVSTDIRAGFYPEAEAVGVGAGLITPIGVEDRWYFNPNAEMAFGDRDVISLNGDVHYDLAYQQPTHFWLGAGPALIMRETARNDREAEMGVNVLAGFGRSRGDVRPFGQLKGVVSENSGVALMGGVRF